MSGILPSRAQREFGLLPSRRSWRLLEAFRLCMLNLVAETYFMSERSKFFENELDYRD